MSDIDDNDILTECSSSCSCEQSSDLVDLVELCNGLIEKTEEMIDEIYKNTEVLLELTNKINDSNTIFVLYGEVGRVDIQDVIQEAYDISLKDIEEKGDVTFGSKLIELLEKCKDTN